MAVFQEDSVGSFQDDNVVVSGRGHPSGTTVLTITDYPTDGNIYLHRDGNLTQLSPFNVPYQTIIQPYVDFVVTYEPNGDFAGNAGSLTGYVTNTYVPTSTFDEPVWVAGVNGDDPTSISILQAPLGTEIPEGANGGVYYDQSFIQTPGDTLETWFVQLTGTDPDIEYASGHAIKDFLRFTIPDPDSPFEIIRLDGASATSPHDDIYLLAVRNGVVFDHETTPTVSVTVRVDDNQPGAGFGELERTFTFGVADRSETIGSGTPDSPLFAYDTASEGADSIVGSSEDDVIRALGGNDLLIGLDGDDILDGGAGAGDAASFAGMHRDYMFEYDAGLLIRDANTTDGDEGRDRLENLEALAFADSVAILNGTVWTFSATEGGPATRTLEMEAGGDLRTLDYDVNGGLSGLTRYDGSDSRDWESYTDTFNTSGARTTRDLIYDNGDTRAQTFVNGVVTSKIITEADGDVETTLYGASGLRESVTFEDITDTRGWTSRAVTYDAAGDRTGYDITYDDGRVLERTYLNDVISTRVETQADGDVETTLYDVNGNRDSFTFQDISDSRSWTSYAYTFDENGIRTGHDTVYDDGEVLARTYVDDLLTSKVVTEVDGDVKTTQYGTDGLRDSFTFEDISDSRVWTSYTDTYDATGVFEMRTFVWDDIG